MGVNVTDRPQGTSADSNILKIYGMLDRDNGDSTNNSLRSREVLTVSIEHYYQVHQRRPWRSLFVGLCSDKCDSQELAPMSTRGHYLIQVGLPGSTLGTKRPKIPLWAHLLMNMSWYAVPSHASK